MRRRREDDLSGYRGIGGGACSLIGYSVSGAETVFLLVMSLWGARPAAKLLKVEAGTAIWLVTIVF